MAIMKYIGLEPSVFQEDSLTVGGVVEVGDEFRITVTGLDGRTHVVEFIATAATVTNVVAGLEAAWNADTDPLCVAVTATDADPVVTLTADVAGIAFSVTVETTESGGGAADAQTFVRAAVTANAGPYDWNGTGNWEGGALPGAGDTVYIEGHTILYGLDQSAAGTILSLFITNTQIGSNPYAGTDVIYLQVRASAIRIGYDLMPGTIAHPVPVNLDTGNVSSQITVYDTGSNGNMPAVRLLPGVNTSDIFILKGSVGIAAEPTESAILDDLFISDASARNTDTEVYIGASVTLDAVTQKGGSVVIQNVPTTYTIESGTVRTQGVGGPATINVKGGTCIANATSTITALNATGGITDFTKTPHARSVTTAKIGIGATIKYDPSLVTFTNDVAPFEANKEIALTGAAV